MLRSDASSARRQQGIVSREISSDNVFRRFNNGVMDKMETTKRTLFVDTVRGKRRKVRRIGGVDGVRGVAACDDGNDLKSYVQSSHDSWRS